MNKQNQKSSSRLSQINALLSKIAATTILAAGVLVSLFTTDSLMAQGGFDQLVIWDANPSADETSGYRVYETNSSGVRLVAISGTNATSWTNIGGFIFTSLGARLTNWNVTVTHRIAVVATNATTEAPLTNWVDIPVRPGPTTPRVVPLTLIVPVPGTAEYTVDLVAWRPWLRTVSTTSNSVSLILLLPLTNQVGFVRAKPSPAMPPIP